MSRHFLLLSALLTLISFGQAQRLPELATPQNYNLTFAPNFDKDNFIGEETIHIEVLKPTSTIVLNSAEIEFQNVTIASEGSTQNAKVTLDKEREMATLTVDKPLAPGAATLQIHYTGVLNNELRGLYLGKDATGQKYAATQFEATDARRAFPSFDEPAYKATFDITVIADKGHTAISNAKMLSDTPGPGAGKHTVHFAPTAKMSSYLVALAVGDFEYMEGSADGIPIRIYGPPGSKQYDAFALAVAEHCMKYFDHYFGIKYPFEKLDMIGLPDFSAGAMENTGLITYREVILQLDDQHSSVGLHKEVAAVIAHEMAHQWFGDLVTMKWWDDIWLNEGFATWMENKAIAAWKPEWDLDLDDVRDAAGTLNVDSLANTRPIHQAADTPAQIQELFDGIAYGKAGAVLRMLEAYLGPDAFRAGVDEYLKKYSYSNATADDFWGTLAAVSKKPVDRIMPTFVKQPGAPIVTVSLQCVGNTAEVTLSQRRYFYDRTLFDKGNSPELWQVPVCMKSAPVQAGASNPAKCELLTKKENTFHLPSCAPWVLTNAGAAGYYRSGYPTEMLRAMAHHVEPDLTPAERIMLLGDAWASVRVGRQEIGDYLAVAEGLKSDRNRAVVSQLLDELGYIGDYLVTDSDRTSYQLWVRRLLTPLTQELGWQARPGDTDEQKSLRARVFHTLGYTGRDPEVLSQARKLTDNALDNPSAVDGTMASTLFGLAALEGDAALYDRIFARLKSAPTPNQYYLYLEALAEFSDPKLLDRTLQFALTPDVRSQDALGLIASVMENPAGERLAWNFVQSRWSDIEKIGGGFTSAEVVQATSVFCDAGLRDEVSSFFAKHAVPTAQRTLKQSLERMSYCVDLKSQQGSKLASWLEQRGASAGK